MTLREQLELTREIAVWEFRRYFKPREFLIGFLFFFVVSGVSFLVGKFLSQSGRPVRLVVLGQGDLPLVVAKGSRIELQAAAGRGVPDLREAVAKGELDALLLIEREGASQLVLRKDPTFKPEIQALLDQEAMQRRLAARGLTPADLATLLAPAALEVVYEGGVPPKSKAVKVTALVFVIATLLGTLLGLGLIFSGITGEKQQRVTEQVIAIVGAQPWIDGKVLGIAAYVMLLIANLSFGSVLLTLGFWSFAGGDTPFPLAAVPIGSFVLCFVLMVLGLLLWNSFFAAIAAIVSDPNTSQKGQVMFLPLLPLLFGLQVLKEPDSLLAKILSLLPFSSPAAMPARYALGTPAPFEIAATIALLLLAIWACRFAAGRIFEVGMLLYGKEPTWAEIAKWIKRG